MQDMTISNNKNNQEIVLTQFETAQGWKVKIDLKTQDIWVSTEDLLTLLGWSTGGTATQKVLSPTVLAHLRALDLSDMRKELKVASGFVARCFDIEQAIAILDFFNAPILKTSQRFGLEVAIKQACGLLEKHQQPQQPQLTSAAAVKMMLPVWELAEHNAGLQQLAAKTNTIPCLIIHDKPFTLRFWTNIHFPGFGLSTRALTRLGRQVAATYQQLKLVLPTHGYTNLANRYTKQDHELICQIFQTMLDEGQLD